MKNRRITSEDAYKIAMLFFENLRHEVEKFSPQVFTKVEQFCAYREFSMVTFFIWQDYHIRILHRSFEPKEFISEQEAFSIALGFVAEYSYRLELDLFEVTLAMYAMRSFPELYKEEVALWDKAVQDTLDKSSVL